MTTYNAACIHDSPRRLFTAALILNTRDVNQNAFTASSVKLEFDSNENCIMVAVTPENKVATVDRFKRFPAECF